MNKQNKSQIKIGAILSYINIIIGNLIPIFYTPIMLKLLGQSEYGLYKMASSTTSYLSLMALGIGSAVSRYIIKARVEEGKEAEEQTFGLFHLIFQFIAVITCVVGMILVINLDYIYGKSLSSEQLIRMQIIVAIMVFNTAIGFSATSYNSVVVTHERFLFVQCINILSTVVSPLLNLVILWGGYGSVGMVILSLVINIMIRILYILYVRCVLKMKPRYNNMPKQYMYDIIRFSFWVLVGEIASQLYNATDMVIIGAVPSLATIGAAVYNIGITFPNIMFSLAQVTPTLFSPKANKMVFEGTDEEGISNLVIKVGRLQAYVVALIAFGFVSFGKPFLEWYVGKGYEEAYWIAIIIMIPNCIPLVQSVARAVMTAKNMHKFRSIVYLVIALINVVFTLIFVDIYGLMGAAIPTGIAFLVGHGLILNIYYWKKVKIDIPRFWKSVVPIFLMAIVLTLVTLTLYQWIDFYNVLKMFEGILIYIVVYCMIQWKFVMNEEEKNIFSNSMKKIRRR